MSAKKSSKIRDVDKETLERLYHMDGMTGSEIAAIYSCSSHSVYTRMADLGIQSRGGSRTKKALLVEAEVRGGVRPEVALSNIFSKYHRGQRVEVKERYYDKTENGGKGYICMRPATVIEKYPFHMLLQFYGSVRDMSTKQPPVYRRSISYIDLLIGAEVVK